MRTLQADLDAAIAFHGHLCSGMVLGVRLARLAMRYLGIEEPLVYKDLIVYVEMDRCVADAVYVVTGCSLGRRRLKWMDYGKVAATFVDLAVDRSVRVAVVANRFPAAGDGPDNFLAGDFRRGDLQAGAGAGEHSARRPARQAAAYDQLHCLRRTGTGRS